MKTEHHTISITPDELDAIGAALELYLEHEYKVSPKLFDAFENETVDLLRDLTQCGYTLYIPGKKQFHGELTTDVDKWLKAMKKKVVQ